MNTKEKIIEATFLLSLEHGYNNVSIKQIKKKANLSTSSIYHHFKNKEEILFYLVKKNLVDITDDQKEYIKSLEIPLIKKLEILYYYSFGNEINSNKKNIQIDGHNINSKEYYLMFAGIYHQYPEYRHLFTNAGLEGIEFFKELIDETKDKGEINKDIDSEKMAFFIFSNMRGTVEIWLNSNYKPEELIVSNLEIIEKILK
ncbi:hypothetical protein SDC9_03556 [bioreactor metagenome]|uniref:HTH tetR-type domain-containing protein n=1 Tax=bioreactor metagenome TaxID=1076179 RepID=A0A644SWL5_9ZZZZ|nr:TetR/AcrR family transcriptional regulator [Methanobrevibacter sp.]MEA4956174.1 TetR/AcrR family transcriptional regulator [Methanobrevibacter sp.]